LRVVQRYPTKNHADIVPGNNNGKFFSIAQARSSAPGTSAKPLQKDSQTIELLMGLIWLDWAFELTKHQGKGQIDNNSLAWPALIK
jgi:hypothetical protein